MNEITNMEINVTNNQPIIEFTFFDVLKKPFKIDFLVDTWFMWSLALIVNKVNSNLLKIIEVFDMKELDDKKWLQMWNWLKARTSSWKIIAKFFSDIEFVDVLIIEWESDDMPVLWIEFLKANKKHLSLNFFSEVFKLV